MYLYVHAYHRRARIHTCKFFKYSFFIRFRSLCHHRRKKFMCQAAGHSQTWNVKTKAKIQRLEWNRSSALLENSTNQTRKSSSPTWLSKSSKRSLGFPRGNRREASWAVTAAGALLPEAHLVSRRSLRRQPSPSGERDEQRADGQMPLLD